MSLPESEPTIPSVSAGAIASVVGDPEHEIIALPSDSKKREPRGYSVLYTLAILGLFTAIFGPASGGISVKVQELVGLDKAPGVFGIIAGVGAFVSIFAQPLAGRLSDRTTSRFGMRRPWVIVGCVGVFASLLVAGFAGAVVVLLIAYCAAQVFSNFAQVAETATVADQVPEPRRGFISGLTGVASNAAALLAAFALAYLPTMEMKFAIPGAIGLVFGLLFAFTLKDRVLPREHRPAFSAKQFFGTFLFNPVRHRNLGWAWLTKAMVIFGWAAVGTYITLFLGTDFGMKINEQLQFNLYATIISTGFAILFSFFGGRLSDRLGRRRIFVTVGGSMLGLAIVMISVTPLFGPQVGLVVLLIAEAFLGAGGGLFLSVDQALCIEVLPDADDMAKDLGVLNMANQLPATLAPFLAGTFVIPIANHLFPGSGYEVWFALAAVVSIAGSLLVYKIKGVK